MAAENNLQEGNMGFIDTDVIALCGSGVLLLAYYLYLAMRVRRDPDFTVHSVSYTHLTLPTTPYV